MTSTEPLDVVTGAFSYSGAAIARQLQAVGRRVRTLTGHPDRAPADTNIDVRALDFGNPGELVQSMRGAHTLYNTYWVRFAHGRVDHQLAAQNSRILFEAAVSADIRRIVHVSITHPSLNSPYPYFRGKAEVEQMLAASGVPYAIVRPAILFGGDGVLINNVAWLLRHLPVFAIGGRGDYRVRGIHVDDLAQLCVALGAASDTAVVDAVGPQTVTFRELVDAVRAAVGSRALVVSVPGSLVPILSRGVSILLRDRLLTREEYHAMSDGLADSNAQSAGRIVFTEWVATHGPELGRRYANELDRHFHPRPHAAAGLDRRSR
ncbi:MAG: epimerase [Pseudonocardiales bacterium]|nr:MAG: epimerase [Pseudonocardiales bacterium]